VKHAFDTVRLPRVIADIATENQASLHIAQKLGMQWVGYDACDGMRYERYRLARDDLR
jgi:RimJ/RimL family protein N-acetyltransferase